MATAVHYCGHCGTQLAPGTAYCGRCGAAQPTELVMAHLAYSYPLARPGAAPGLRRVNLGQVAVAAVLLGILSIATVVVSALAVSRVITPPHQACTANCGAKIVVPLTEPKTYRSTAFKFEVDYRADWTTNSEDANGISLATRLGRLDVTGMKASQPVDQLIQATVTALPSATWQDVTLVSDLKGAHIGDQDGKGAVYAANMVGSNSTATKVRFVVIAATKGAVTVLMFAVNAADTKNFPNGIPEGSDFDYLCQEFRWG